MNPNPKETRFDKSVQQFFPTSEIENVHMVKARAKAKQVQDEIKIQQLEKELEFERIRLSGCGVAALQNTEESKFARIDRSNQYWSDSYDMVCRAVDSQIELRARVAELEEENEKLRLLINC